MMKRIAFFILGVCVIMGLAGCGKQKYQISFDSDVFVSEKVTYVEGEKVTCYYDLIATDTDYSFYSDSEDIELKTDYDDCHGYVITFTMPGHDVRIGVNSTNSMVKEVE